MDRDRTTIECLVLLKFMQEEDEENKGSGEKETNTGLGVEKESRIMNGWYEHETWGKIQRS